MSRCTDVCYDMTRQIFDFRLSLAPLASPKSILDVGTGTGNWALDIADQYPSASVIATDLSPIQSEFVAPNLEFQIADCEEEWTFSQTFDLIHVRNLNGSISDWSQLIGRASQQLSTGGWLELIEFGDVDGDIPAESALSVWQHAFRNAASLNNCPIQNCDELGKKLRNAGLQEVQSCCMQVSSSKPQRQNDILIEEGADWYGGIRSWTSQYSSSAYTISLWYSRRDQPTPVCRCPWMAG